jgi:N-methylhydantoinase A
MVMSGPAGGVAATQALCKKLNVENAIAYDMGGTSADMSAIVSGDPVFTDTVMVTGIPIRTLAIDIESIGAGGGSIAWLDEGGALKVGPMSAGSEPGPACYGQGGTDFTVSDANLILGVLGQNISGITLNNDESKKAAENLCNKLGMDIEKLSAGVIDIVNNNMVSAVKRVSVSKGYDPRNFTFVAFGGAGPMHTCAIADALGIKRIIIPPFAGAFSALGIMNAPIRFDIIRTILTPLDKALEMIPDVLKEFYKELEQKVHNRTDDVINHETLDMRYIGQGHEINIPFSENVEQEFHKRHEELFGFKIPENKIEVVNVKLVSELPVGEISFKQNQLRPVTELSKRNVKSNENTSVYRKDFFGSSVDGPCIIEDATSTIYVEPGWIGKLDLEGILRLERE